MGACGLMCYQYSCRNLIYCSCIFLWFLALAHFILALFFSATTPLIYYGCSYATDSLDNPEIFKDYMEPVIRDSDLGEVISMCLKRGDGEDLLNFVADDPMAVQILSLKDLMHNLQHFNAPKNK